MEKHLVPLTIDTIPIGRPLQFALRSESGALLANRGYVVTSRQELERMVGRGRSLCVDIAESAAVHRAYIQKLNQKITNNDSLYEIKETKLTADDLKEQPPAMRNGFPDWMEYQVRLHNLLKMPDLSDFIVRIEKIHQDLKEFLNRSADAALAALVYLSAEEMERYSAMHAMLTWAVCMMTARHDFKWSEEKIDALGKAALTMNISMTDLQDRLARQQQPLDKEQELIVLTHPARSRALLEKLGVKDTLWLEAVQYHRDHTPGPMSSKGEGQQLGRLIQRADVFGARMAPRLHRQSLTVTAAMQASYLDEARQPDEAGAAIVKTLGIYAPGSFVQLVGGEVAIVTRRVLSRPGVMGKEPRVAVVINKDGMAVNTLLDRDTSQPAFKITGALSARDVKVHIALEQLLKLASPR